MQEKDENKDELVGGTDNRLGRLLVDQFAQDKDENTDEPVGETDNRLGRLLVDQAKIKEEDIEKILAYARKKQIRFGEAARKLRLISKIDLELAMASQFDYPYLEKKAGGYSRELVSAFSPFSSKGQALRVLRSQILLRWSQAEERTLAIISADPGEGCSYIAANLAVMFSQLGHKTLLVDADLQNGRQHKIFGNFISNDTGLSSVLVGRTDYESVIYQLPFFRDLSLIPTGTAPPGLGELFNRPELKTLVSKLRAKYDVIIFDTPPSSSNLGADAIAAVCNNALVVVRKDITMVSNAKNLIEQLHDARGSAVRVVGAVMNK